MLYRFERSGLVSRARKGLAEEMTMTTSNSWFLTPSGSQQLKLRLALLVKMLRSARETADPLSFRWQLDDVEDGEHPPVASTAELV